MTPLYSDYSEYLGALGKQWRSHLCVRGCTCIPWFFKFPPNNMVCLYICTSWNCIHAPPKTRTSNFVDTLYLLGLKHWWCCYRWQSYLVAFTCWLCYFYLIFVICNVTTFFLINIGNWCFIVKFIFNKT